MITQMYARNFKSWADTSNIRMAPLTGFFGPNSSGKTSLLQLLLLLKQTAESNDRNLVLHTGDQNSLVDLGTFADILHGEASSLEIGLSWELIEPMAIPDMGGAGTKTIQELAFATQIRQQTDEIFVESLRYTASELMASMSRQDDGYYDVAIEIGGRRPQKMRARPFKYISKPIKSYGFSDEARRSYQNTDFLSDLTFGFEQLFQRLYYLGPLREYPERVYTWGGEQYSDVGKKGERAIPVLLARGQERLSKKPGRSKKLEGQIADWLKEMGMVSSFRTHRIASGQKLYEVRIKRDADSREVVITDMGFGISQVLPVLVLCYSVPEGSTIILEQPEIHLHPAAQSILADVLIDVIQTRNVQIIFESHSEHLLRRLQRRIAEAEIQADDTAFYFCQMEHGQSHLNPLDVDIFGNIRNWPQDFFGDMTGDLLKMVDAEIERQM